MECEKQYIKLNDFYSIERVKKGVSNVFKVIESVDKEGTSHFIIAEFYQPGALLIFLLAIFKENNFA